VTAALRQWRAEIPGDEPSGSTLWPEHADVAIRAADINYGASPGDEYVAEPYLYVGPPAPPTHSPDGSGTRPSGPTSPGTRSTPSPTPSTSSAKAAGFPTADIWNGPPGARGFAFR